MRLIGCDLHASQQSIAMLDRDTGSTARSSAVVVWRGSRKGGVRAGVPVLALVLAGE